MGRRINPFTLAAAAILAAAYAYAAGRLASTLLHRLLLALPFLLAWSLPAYYWTRSRDTAHPWDEAAHAAIYLCMGWINFLVLALLVRDLLLWWSAGFAPASRLHATLASQGPVLAYGAALVALGLGMLAALGGPRVRRVRIPVSGLDPRLEGLRIVQISDLHVGLFIGRRYVRRVVAMANRLAPHIVALTGDLVDGPVEKLASQVAPLADLEPRGQAYLVLGNHEYYSGTVPWTGHFRSLGLQVLLNGHALASHQGATILVGGVLDPAARLFAPPDEPRPDLAAPPGVQADFRLLLAHNPKLAPLAEKAGFDLQLSGHTHAGQFFPWTLVVRLVHAPHVAGLSRQGRLQVYVSPGTGTWGPPVRFGTSPEITLLELVAVPGS